MLQVRGRSWRLDGAHATHSDPTLEVDVVGLSSPGPASLSTALEGLVSGPAQHGVVLTSTRFASYLVLDAAADPAVVALVGPGAVRLPIAAALQSLPQLAPQTPARVGRGEISAGGHTWRPVRWWDPRPRVDPGELRAHGWRLRQVVAAEPATAFGIDPDRAQQVVAALADGDAAPAVAVLGSGPGLTPAGDDVVAGALAALALTERLPVAAAAAVTSAAASRTTSLSAALLIAAARGQVVPQAARTLRALGRGADVDAVTAATQQLFAVGSTSGHDLALGLAAALLSTAPVPAPEAT